MNKSLGLLDKTIWGEDLPREFYDALTFGDLEIGDKYIGFPLPGDNQGHGGFKGGSYLFKKVEIIDDQEIKYNSERLKDHAFCAVSDSMLVLRVLE